MAGFVDLEASLESAGLVLDFPPTGENLRLPALGPAQLQHHLVAVGKGEAHGSEAPLRRQGEDLFHRSQGAAKSEGRLVAQHVFFTLGEGPVHPHLLLGERFLHRDVADLIAFEAILEPLLPGNGCGLVVFFPAQAPPGVVAGEHQRAAATEGAVVAEGALDPGTAGPLVEGALGQGQDLVFLAVDQERLLALDVGRQAAGTEAAVGRIEEEPLAVDLDHDQCPFKPPRIGDAEIDQALPAAGRPHQLRLRLQGFQHRLQQQRLLHPGALAFVQDLVG